MEIAKNNGMKRIQTRHGIVLVTLVVVVALLTSMLLGHKAETFTYPLNCIMAEHVHAEECYEVIQDLQCSEEHEHEEDCYVTLMQQLTCETVCHEHVASCYAGSVPEGVSDALGKVIPYALTTAVVNEDAQVQPAEADNSAPVLQQPVQPDYIAVTRSGFVDLSESEFLATLSYFDENSTSESVLDKWIRITSDTVVPIDAKIRLTVNFKDLDINTLNASGGKAFYTVPDPLRNNIADGALKDLTDKQIATATRGENNQVVFTFDMNWVQEMISGNTTKLSGSFNIDVEIDPKKVGEDSSFTMTLNRENFQLQFEKEWREKRSNLELEKSEPVVKEVVKTVNEEEEVEYYFEYTLRVTADAEGYDVPNVKIVDLFTAGREYIEYYVGVTAESSLLTSTDAEIAPMEQKPEGVPSGSVYLGAIVNDGTPAEGSYNDTDAPGTLVWDIGTLKAGETRILTYRAKIKESYTHTQVMGASKPGITHPSIKNKAQAYAGSYVRDASETIYEPNNDFASGYHKKENMGSKVSYYDPALNKNFTVTKPTLLYDEDGNVILRYRILLKAKDDNKFTYPNIKIRDELFNPNNGGISTDVAYKPYISYVEDSFILYEGDISFDQYGSDALTPSQLKALTVDNKAKKFDAELGRMPAGRCITLFYDVKIDKGAYALDGSEIGDPNKIVIRNTFFTMNGNGQNEADRFDRWGALTVFDRKQWSRKSAASEMTSEITNVSIPEADGVYDYDGTDIKAVDDITSFEVPKGAIKYTVVLNEDGKWDLTNSTLKDTLGEHLRFSGYAKVNAYKVGDVTFTNETPMSEVEQFIKTQPLLKTSWLNINDLTTFTFVPKQLGFDKNVDPELQRTAYVIEYYAVPYNVGDVTKVTVSNKFTISGDVGDGIYVGGNGSIGIENSVTITGGQSFGIRKKGWYYERIVETNAAKNWPNGRMFWALEVDGTIKAGRQIQDTLPSGQQIYKMNSFVAVYKGNLGEGKDWNDYSSVEDLEANANLEKLTGVYGINTSADADYEFSFSYDINLLVTFKKDISLESDETLFIVLQTTPTNANTPNAESLDIKTLNNSVYTRENESSDWIHETDATYGASSKGPAYKVFDGTVLVNDDGFVPIGDQGEYAFDDVLWDKTEENGIYTEWIVNLNWNGEISGLAEVSDQLPAGLEPVYVRMFEIGPDYDNPALGFEKPITPDIPELETADWIKNTVDAKEYNGSDMLSCTYYYNPKTNEIRWNVANLYYDGEKNSRNVAFQIVTKSVSDNLLLPSKEITFDNTLTVKGKDGKVTKDTANGGYTYESLVKNTTPEYQEDPEKFGVRIPFTIDVNQYAMDLNLDGDTLTMIDEPSEYLSFDTESIKVYAYDSAFVEEYKNITSSATITTNGSNPKNVQALYDGKWTGDNDGQYLFKFHNGPLNEEKEILLTYRQPRMMDKFVISFEKYNNNDSNYFQFVYSILAQDSTKTDKWSVVADHVTANRLDQFQQTYIFDKTMYNKVKIVMHSCKTGQNHNSNGWPAIGEFEIWGDETGGENVKNQYENATYTLLDKSKWNAALVNNNGAEALRITVPDNKRIKVEYTMLYTGPKGQSVTIRNNIRWNGMPQDSGSDYEDGSFRYDLMGSVDANTEGIAGVKIIKADENNLRQYLQGAVFTISECTYDNAGNITELQNHKYMIDTNENGIAEIVVSDKSLNTLKTNTVYSIRETIAPEGYIADDDPVYFVVAAKVIINGNYEYMDFPAGVNVHTESPTFEYVCLNAKGKIELEKKFLMNEETQITPLDGSYHFGLFDQQNPTKDPLQIISIVVKNGEISYRRDLTDKIESPVFNNIAVSDDKEYYIYELDADMKPVKNEGKIEVDGAGYIVKYPDADPIIVDGSKVDKKTVENYLTFELPETGGNGTLMFTLIGFMLMGISALLIAKNKKQPKKPHSL